MVAHVHGGVDRSVNSVTISKYYRRYQEHMTAKSVKLQSMGSVTAELHITWQTCIHTLYPMHDNYRAEHNPLLWVQFSGGQFALFTGIIYSAKSRDVELYPCSTA